LFLGSKDAESLLIYTLVSVFCRSVLEIQSVFWRSVTFLNIDTKWLNLILMYVQFSVLYLVVQLMVGLDDLEGIFQP